MNPLIFTAALLCASAGFSSSAAADPRIASHYYEPGEIVTVHGGAGVQSTIAFGADEHIENIAVGNSLAWQVTPNRRADLLFIKPLLASARTNMTVVTDQRTYLFDLVSGGRGSAVYMLRFTYPDPPAKPPTVTIDAAQAATPQIVAELRPNPATINFAWTAAGTRTLLPSRYFDDGRSTYLAWPANTGLPAILVRDASGAEAPVNYSVQGDYIVVDGVPAQLVLRLRKKVATLTLGPRKAPAAIKVGDVEPSSASAAPVAGGKS